MVQAVFTIGIIITVVIVILSLLFEKASKRNAAIAYYPSIVLFLVGLFFLAFASLLGKVDVMESGFGGLGIASLFGGAIGFFVTSIVASRDV